MADATWSHNKAPDAAFDVRLDKAYKITAHAQPWWSTHLALLLPQGWQQHPHRRVVQPLQHTVLRRTRRHSTKEHRKTAERSV